MQTETVEAHPLPYVLMKPEGFSPGAGYPLVVLLHGFGASMYDLPGLAPAIDDTGYVYAFPNGPYVLQGMIGFSWRLRQGVEQPAPDAPPLDDMLDAFLQDVMQRTGAEPGKIALGGFSQGGGITLSFGLPRPETFAGLAVLSGAFRGDDDLAARLPVQRQQRVFIAHGRFDMVVSAETGQATRDYVQSLGYSTTFNEYDMAHSISGDVIRDLIPWLHEALPPKA